MADRIGTQIGNYRLTTLLGQGGFADVYLGEHLHLGTQAALKLLHAPLVQAEQVEQFRQEARRIAQLSHPHIVRVLDFGFAGELPYLVLEYAEDGTLRQRHSLGTLVPLATIRTYVGQIAEGLQYAHDQQVIHRDLKPQNLLLGRGGQVLLADFGISVVAESTSRQSSKEFAGTVAYAAPEQIQGHPRPASDQYALGVVVYEWLSGQLPFTGSLPEVIWKQMQAAPPALRRLLPSLPAEVEQVVLTALSKDPSERFASVRAFARALDLASQEALLASGNVPELALLPSLPLNPSAPTVPTPVPTAQRSAPPPSTSIPPAAAQTTPPRSSSTPALSTTERALAPTQAASTPPASGAGERTRVDSWPPAAPAIVRVAAPAAVPAPGPVASRAKHRWGWGLLVGLLALVVVSGGLVGLHLAGQGAPTAVGTTPPSATPTATSVPKPAPGTITEFPIPTANNNPGGITLGPDGDVWFAEGGSNQIVGKIGRITPGGSITEFPVPTANSEPDSISAGPDGALWFTEFNGNQIGRITPGGSITEFPLPTPNNFPDRITAGPDGNLWFTELGSNQIGRITRGGSITEFPLPISDSRPVGIAAGSDGNLWFTEINGNRIGRITTGGSITEFPIPMPNSSPADIIAGPDSNLWFVQNQAIGRITTGGSITEFPLSGGGALVAGLEPSTTNLPLSGGSGGGITAGPDGNVWCTTSSTIDRITPGGTFTMFPGHGAQQITAGPDGNLWFTEGAAIGRITTGK